uniref:Inositol-3-phosphate synthase 1 n=1 Tax=Serinus canaria TaxID=9135 RepID=A0A8C9MES3_SERCA
MAEPFLVESPNVTYSKDFIEAKYTYSTVHVCKENGVTKVRPCSTRFTFRTGRQVPRLGVMLVGWGGNNGTTVTAAVLANRLGLSWMTKTGRKVGVPSKVGVPRVTRVRGFPSVTPPRGVPGVTPAGGCPQPDPSKVG